MLNAFSYPDQQSEFDVYLSTETSADTVGYIARIRTSAGYNICEPPYHIVGIHLGEPTPILHRQQVQESIHFFQPGDSIVAPVGAPVQYAHPLAIDRLYIYLSPAELEQTAQAMGISAHELQLRSRLGGHDPVIKRIAHMITQELESPDLPGAALMLETLKTQLSVHLLRHYVATPLAHAPLPLSERLGLNSVIEYIDTYLERNMTLNELAALEHITPYHFSRLFRQTYGVPPHQYIIRKRVERAKELLKNPRMSVMEVALAVGFSDHSHLIRHYKRLTGTTPRA